MTPDEAVVVRQLLGLVVEQVHGPGADDIVKRAEALLSPDPCVVGGVEVRALTAKQLGFAASDDDSYRSGPTTGAASGQPSEKFDRRPRIAVLRSDLDDWFKTLEQAARETAGPLSIELAATSGEVAYWRQQRAIAAVPAQAGEFRG